ncbi:MAG: tRNA guanosine(34) transglycosylase Tgt [Simkaniaceae bacterium]|nr:tRNA guanosine(34) transglycosylase Tgt [Simkaniaceae bacterium]
MIKTPFAFELIHRSTRSQARVGRIHTGHGVIDTPGFVAVGTNGTLKTIDSHTASQTGLQLMFCNTYHLLLYPGPETVERAGGLHKFINRPLPLITDSGGFQVFSLAYGGVDVELKRSTKPGSTNAVMQITDEGIRFRSYRDGSRVFLTPERSIRVQKALGADIIIPLDELPPYHIERQALERSLRRTHAWEKRSLDEHLKDRRGQAIYGVIHGGIDPSLRKESCRFLTALPFDGFAIGGSMGKNREEMLAILTATVPRLPPHMPIHLLGIADPPSLDLCVPLGIDTFDSAFPTRIARHGTLLTTGGSVKITRGAYKNVFTPLSPGCTCHTCLHYTPAYLHHLFKARESAGPMLASLHNLRFMIDKMTSIRRDILNNKI